MGHRITQNQCLAGQVRSRDGERLKVAKSITARCRACLAPLLTALHGAEGTFQGPGVEFGAAWLSLLSKSGLAA